MHAAAIYFSATSKALLRIFECRVFGTGLFSKCFSAGKTIIEP
jgi:hypothetical protein